MQGGVNYPLKRTRAAVLLARDIMLMEWTSERGVMALHERCWSWLTLEPDLFKELYCSCHIRYWYSNELKRCYGPMGWLPSKRTRAAWLSWSIIPTIDNERKRWLGPPNKVEIMNNQNYGLRQCCCCQAGYQWNKWIDEVWQPSVQGGAEKQWKWTWAFVLFSRDVAMTSALCRELLCWSLLKRIWKDGRENYDLILSEKWKVDPLCQHTSP
jgi:hypothetical protein